MTTASQRSSRVESFKVMDVLKRANELESLGHAVLHCEIGQPQTGAPAAVVQAAAHALSERSTMGYTDAFGLLALREKIAEHYVTRYPLQSPPPTDRIVVTTGSSGAFLLAFTACFDAGDVVAIASSGYPCYRNILSALGCPQANILVNAEFKLTAVELEMEVKRRQASGEPRLKGLILSSPSNPTGSMLTPDELRDLCVLCEHEEIQFLSDEIYHGISYGKDTATALQFSDQALVINSFSKYYSSKFGYALLLRTAGHSRVPDGYTLFSPVSGWRLGWMVIPSHLIDAVNSLQQNMFINAPTISQTAALKCWDDTTLVELESHVERYRTSRTVILQELANISDLDPRNIAPADGGFYVYIDLGETNVAEGMGSIEMCKCLLEEEHVAFTPGNDFEDPATHLGDRRFRISYAGGIETATQAMERFHRFWSTWIVRVRERQVAEEKE